MTDDDAKRHLSDEQRRMFDLAAKATPGIWLWEDNGYLGTGIGEWILQSDALKDDAVLQCDEDCEPDKPTRDFIAAAHPTAVLAILRELAKARADLSHARKAMGDRNPVDWERVNRLCPATSDAIAPPPSEGTHNP